MEISIGISIIGGYVAFISGLIEAIGGHITKTDVSIGLLVSIIGGVTAFISGITANIGGTFYKKRKNFMN